MLQYLAELCMAFPLICAY